MAQLQSLDENISVAHGRWGEDVAVETLRREGYLIVDRNSRPCPWNRKLEIDIVAYDKSTDTMVFVEVKQHAAHVPHESRIRGVDRKKFANLRKAFNAWRRCNKWFGAYRFDIVEIFGVPEGGRPEVDHVEKVQIFGLRERFVRWG
jgi:Holliday junction resolvase-like predicted endonuclease